MYYFHLRKGKLVVEKGMIIALKTSKGSGNSTNASKFMAYYENSSPNKE